MANQQGRRYRADEIVGRIPADRGDLFRGVIAWQTDVGNWRRSVRENLQETPGRVVRRTVWDHPEYRDERVAIDVVECGSSREAVAALLDRLEWNQLAELPAGPVDLGIAAFQHPEPAPPAIFFARDNLCISVLSFARRAAPVRDIAAALDRRLSSAPSPGDGELGVRADPASGDDIRIHVTLPFSLSDDGYVRYIARGGTLEIRDDVVAAYPAGAEPMDVEVFAIEPGRAAISGGIRIPR